MVDTDDTRRTMDEGQCTMPGVWHKLPTGELKKGLEIIPMPHESDKSPEKIITKFAIHCVLFHTAYNDP